MFGYVTINCEALSVEQKTRFRAMYCGMCRTLGRRFGSVGRFTLSYDMTFLSLVLSALYEPEETSGSEACPPHPFRKHPYVLNPYMEYAADLNLMLAYHKCADNWNDDRNPLFGASMAALKRAYRAASKRLPEKAKAIEDWMRAIAEIEKSGRTEIDPPMNLTGRMLGDLFVYQNDFYADSLRRMGEGLGRFIYFMDAYDDLKKDVKSGSFNPLKPLMEQQNFEELCMQSMKMMMADCADAFERLPILKDADLIRNILYSGVWSKYGWIQAQKEKGKGES